MQWTAIQRPEVFSGYVYYKSGDGPGTWKKWQKVYIAETQNYNIEVYKTEQDFQKGKKPKKSVCPCGYKLIRQVPDYYKDVLEEIGPHMGQCIFLCSYSRPQEGVSVLWAFQLSYV